MPLVPVQAFQGPFSRPPAGTKEEPIMMTPSAAGEDEDSDVPLQTTVARGQKRKVFGDVNNASEENVSTGPTKRRRGGGTRPASPVPTSAYNPAPLPVGIRVPNVPPVPHHAVPQHPRPPLGALDFAYPALPLPREPPRHATNPYPHVPAPSLPVATSQSPDSLGTAPRTDSNRLQDKNERLVQKSRTLEEEHRAAKMDHRDDAFHLTTERSKLKKENYDLKVTVLKLDSEVKMLRRNEDQPSSHPTAKAPAHSSFRIIPPPPPIQNLGAKEGGPPGTAPFRTAAPRPSHPITAPNPPLTAHPVASRPSSIHKAPPMESLDVNTTTEKAYVAFLQEKIRILEARDLWRHNEVGALSQALAASDKEKDALRSKHAEERESMEAALDQAQLRGAEARAKLSALEGVVKEGEEREKSLLAEIERLHHGPPTQVVEKAAKQVDDVVVLRQDYLALRKQLDDSEAQRMYLARQRQDEVARAQALVEEKGRAQEAEIARLRSELGTALGEVALLRSANDPLALQVAATTRRQLKDAGSSTTPPPLRSDVGVQSSVLEDSIARLEARHSTNADELESLRAENKRLLENEVTLKAKGKKVVQELTSITASVSATKTENARLRELNKTLEANIRGMGLKEERLEKELEYARAMARLGEAEKETHENLIREAQKSCDAEKRVGAKLVQQVKTLEESTLKLKLKLGSRGSGGEGGESASALLEELEAAREEARVALAEQETLREVVAMLQGALAETQKEVASAKKNNHSGLRASLDKLKPALEEERRMHGLTKVELSKLKEELVVIKAETLELKRAIERSEEAAALKHPSPPADESAMSSLSSTPLITPPSTALVIPSVHLHIDKNLKLYMEGRWAETLHQLRLGTVDWCFPERQSPISSSALKLSTPDELCPTILLGNALTDFILNPGSLD